MVPAGFQYQRRFPYQRNRERRLAVGVALAVALAAPAASAQEPQPPEAAPPVSLDQLLRVPDSVDLPSSGRPAQSRSEWRRRYIEASTELEASREALAIAQAELEELASEQSDWQVSAPGLGGGQQAPNPDKPLSYRLRQEIKKRRAEVEGAERRLRELEVEASLAGVPPSWLSAD